ncbi:MAG: dTDP-4-dehydrorhamnose 3,5-epimerase [Polyangiaceae bacterium]|jgi:dTDP-4-dehydrorhamnose 3,5-epimerase
METERLSLSGLLLVKPRVYRDPRGMFVETYQAERYRGAGIDCSFVQDNYSRSSEGTLRGLHYQSSPGQAKLVCVSEGSIFDVVVDIRPESPTFGRWDAVVLDGEKHWQLFVPVGFAHGFCVLSATAAVMYKVSSPYNAATECAIAYDDPTLGVKWPTADPVLSDRDRTAESFSEYAKRAMILRRSSGSVRAP